ncbi:HbrB-like protein [Lepidopterella palustris CBS 459.81]|uniref:HbrB-like protein n=1 Tax=Lepidopterella palustris CBS 459.81 TaxID=1314670 RepID=A0A8E2E9D3_9PEZI|nr:HbrB-like protein [Lepidopterella palustris CBS 459.81]
MTSSPPPVTPTYSPSRRRDSDSDSDASQLTTLSVQRRSPLPPPRSNMGNGKPIPQLPPVDTSGQNFSRPSAPPRSARSDLPFRNNSPTVEHSAAPTLHFGHRPRQRSQGYFEPSLPSNAAPAMSNHLTASQIAAQAAMHIQNHQHIRKRSTTMPDPGNAPPTGRRQPGSPPPAVPTMTFATNGVTYQNGLVGGHRMAATTATATTAANAAFPRSPMHSPSLLPEQQQHGSPKPGPVQQEKPVKEKSKMKLFSKPKSIGISKEKDFERKHPALPSPGKIGMHSTGGLNRMMMNQSTTSLVDPSLSSVSGSLYSSANASTSTLVPTERAATSQPEGGKEKHKHHFLSRQKNKLKDKDDHHLPLSSAMSNSKPTDPNMPQPLYSFAAPSSPGHSSTFAASMSGLDLRHGGRALRQKKKEEKAASLAPYLAGDPLDPPFRERNQSFSTERSEWPGSSITGASPALGVPSPGTGLAMSYSNDLAGLGNSFGLQGLTPDDAWPLLKARLLHIFEGEDPRPPIEDFNALVSVHIRRCIQKRAPTILIEDLSELLETGFTSLDQTLRHVPDERLIPHLVEIWLVVFTTILPFLQAVFLPLDLEFKGRGGLMTATAAAEFWGAALPDSDVSVANRYIPTLGEDLDVRRITLLTFRDTVILPRNETLMAIFSRLSLENLNAGPGLEKEQSHSLPDERGFRPGSSSNNGADGGSYNSNSSMLGDLAASTSATTTSASSTTTANTAGFGTTPRSRATSNTSAGSFSSSPHHHPYPNSLTQSHSNTPNLGSSLGLNLNHPLPPPPVMDSAKVTETVGRMLQCVSVLASVQSGDESQRKMERLTKELKYNWLGRGRTGRQRRGFVGPKAGGWGGRGVGTGGVGGVIVA